MTTRSGSAYGSGRTITASTTEKITAFAPMPSASVAVATSEKTGDLRSNRAAYRTSETQSIRPVRRGEREQR